MQGDLREKVSARIGEYLLVGATMLASHCPVCGTVLMRKRRQLEGESICVLCDELSPRDDELGDANLADAAAVAHRARSPAVHMNGHAHMNGHVDRSEERTRAQAPRSVTMAGIPDVVPTTPRTDSSQQQQQQLHRGAAASQFQREVSMLEEVTKEKLEFAVNGLRGATTPASISEWAHSVNTLLATIKAMSDV